MGFADKVSSPLEDPGPLKIFIYGEPGCGKTVFACQAPNCLLLDAENGRRSLLNHPELYNIPVVKVNSFDEAEAVINAIAAKDPYFDNIDTIIVDTITRLQSKQLVEELKKAVTKDKSRHPYLPSQAEFNINNRILERFVLALIERTDKNIIILGHVKEEKDKDKDNEVVLIRPNTSPGLVAPLMGLMDAVFYMSSDTDSKGETTRKLRTLPSRKTKGKNRLAELPVEMINPTFKQILDAADKQREIALSNSNSNN